ncbi:MAG: hypothetical protein J4478_03025 [Candidatus Diapherotrites archaeon]|uniref:Uncharacterized protein n=1 Tax=Candidatus Iainarchaeum sp. TaxID=3101447 RepID=A0A7J4JWZ8_9ARCH|nr:hypothetical protein [Candidatus Diapherotrites archaeon]HIH21974.1 hypothetical protein [Candidatus Diapherotrites archaeon]HIH32787.1 hypothetical protein [Candidatus Diapherotrites archaeon]
MQPVKKFRAGRVDVSIWENSKELAGEQKVLESISIQRSFKGKDGDWQHSKSFSKSDLPNVILATQKAFEYLVLKE